MEHRNDLSKFLNKVINHILGGYNKIQNDIKNIEELANIIVENKFRECKNICSIKTDSKIHIEVSDNMPNSDIVNDDLWIFGYGSLVWKADFPYVSRHKGFITGYERRFYQHSIDHRGTEKKPGRVVTLLHSSHPESKVWGVAYRISKDEKNGVLQHLDYREKNGYERCYTLFHPYNMNNGLIKQSREVLIYIATEENDSYAGHINDITAICDQIYDAVGPSGTNREYVYKLANAMRFLFPCESDDHLFEIEKALRDREKKDLLLSEKIKRNLILILQTSYEKNTPIEDIKHQVASEFQFPQNN